MSVSNTLRLTFEDGTEGGYVLTIPYYADVIGVPQAVYWGSQYFIDASTAGVWTIPITGLRSAELISVESQPVPVS